MSRLVSSFLARTLLASTLAFAGSEALAATIDPELLQSLSAKPDGTPVEAMMLFDEQLDLRALEPELAGLAPWDRAERVVAALEAHAAASQREALRVLDEAVRRGKATPPRTLWTVNGIAFEGDLETIRSLAATKAPARLVHDAPFDLLSKVTTRPRDLLPTNPTFMGAAASDTVWTLGWLNVNRVWIEEGITGTGVVVLHIDSGVDTDHPDLANRFWINDDEIPSNLMDDDDNGYVDDVIGYDFVDEDSDPEDDIPALPGGHGTHTAGNVVGDGSNGTITGVAPGARLMAAKVFPSAGGGAPFSRIYEAQQYGLANGARIITMSLGVSGDPSVVPGWLMRLERINANAIRAAGIVLVVAAGNEHQIPNLDPPYELGVSARVPAPWMDGVSRYNSLGGAIAVGGTGYKTNQVYSLSSRGPADWSEIQPWNDWPQLVKPDIAAPGVGVNSTLRGGSYSGDSWQGTSMSTPHVAGVAALLLEANPTLSPAGVDSLMETTATDLGTPGKDNVFGAGLLNALAAVRAVPTDQYPHLVQAVLEVQDDGGDGIIDPGESFDLVVDFANANEYADATSVSATLVVPPNAYVSVDDAAGSYTDILAGETQSNAADPFRLSVGAGAPQGFEFTLLVTIDSNGGYRRVFDSKLAVGLPDFLTHDVGAVELTVTDQGILGFMDDSQAEGVGFSPVGGNSRLFVGSFWAGNGASYVCNRDYSGSGANLETFEWQVETAINGRMKNLGAVESDQDYEATFNDSGHASPRNVQVTQRSYAWAEAGFNEFVILSYTVRKTAGPTLTDWHAGIFCDWDVGGADMGGSDATRKLTYVNEVDGQYYGVAYLGAEAPSNLTLINNPTYVYPLTHVEDGVKSRFLKGVFSQPSVNTGDDWSALTAVGPFQLTSGDELELAFVMTYGNDLAQLQSNVDAAQQKWLELQATPVDRPDDDIPPSPVFVPTALRQNAPNPFNPQTTIAFSVENAGPVSLTVYDLSGRRVKTLVDGEYVAGEWSADWDGTDEQGRSLASGMYLYRLETSSRSISRKMILVK